MDVTDKKDLIRKLNDKIYQLEAQISINESMLELLEKFDKVGELEPEMQAAFEAGRRDTIKRRELVKHLEDIRDTLETEKF